MSLISPDAILEADVTMIVGVFFLLTLRQALGLAFSLKYIRNASVPLILFIASATILSAGMELTPPEILMALSEMLFILGLMTAAVAIVGMTAEREKSKR